MVERFNGRIKEVLQSQHFRSGEELKVTLHRYVWLYNQKLPQSALASKSPLQAMKDWHKLKPRLFKKQPYDLTGCDRLGVVKMRIFIFVFLVAFAFPMAAISQTGETSDIPENQAAEAHSQVATDEAMVSVLNRMAQDQIVVRKELLDELDQRADEQMVYFNIIIGIGSGLAVLVLGFLTYFAKTYIEGTGNTVKGLVRAEISDQISKHDEEITDLKRLSEDLKKMNHEHKRLEPVLKALLDYERLSGSVEKDPSWALKRLKTLEKLQAADEANKIKPDERKQMRDEAQVLLAIVKQVALSGFFDPNEIYNASAVAGRMGFERQQLELATIAYHMRPSRTHLMAKIDAENNLGVAFEIVDGTLHRLEKPPAEVRAATFNSALEQVKKIPTHQCEIILSRTWNMTERGREDGSFDQYMTALDEAESTFKQRLGDEKAFLPSYYYVTWAQLISRNSACGWRKAALEKYKKALGQLARESKMATWYYNSVREIGEYAKIAGLGDEVAASAEKYGIELVDLDKAERQALLQAIGAEGGLANLINRGGGDDADADPGEDGETPQ